MQESEKNQQLLDLFSQQSPFFRRYIEALLTSIDNPDADTVEVWLGSLPVGDSKKLTQIKLVATQTSDEFIEED